MVRVVMVRGRGRVRITRGGGENWNMSKMLVMMISYE